MIGISVMEEGLDEKRDQSERCKGCIKSVR